MTISIDKPVVYMPAPFTREAIAYAKQKFQLLQPGDLPEEEILAKAEGIRELGLFARIYKVTRSVIERSPNLKIISRNGVGYDSIDKEACLERGIAVTNMPGTNSQAVAELTVTMALSLLRRVPEITARNREGETIASIQAIAPGLHGKTLGLIGMGDIARETAKIFHYGFACKLIVFSPTSPTTRWTSDDLSGTIPHTRVDSLEDLLPQVDILSIHCPYTSQTRNLISAKEFHLMRKSSIILNTARGGIINENDLFEALQFDEIAGAGIDVWTVEPPTKDMHGRFFGLKNCIALPHLGGSTEEAQRLGCMGAVDIVSEYLSGKGAARNRVY